MSVTDILQLPPDPIYDRRRTVQTMAAASIRRRKLRNRIFTGSIIACLVVALVPLFFVLLTIIEKGISAITWGFITKTPVQPTIFAQNNIGGVGNAIVGTLVIVGLAAVLAIPVGIIVSIYLAESDNKIANSFRAVIEILTGLPSILLGVFAYSYIVLTTHTYSGWAGSFALAILMIPVITKASENAIRSVPATLTEAGLSLGARSSTVIRKVVVPAAAPGIITGVLLGLARAIGETAPVLLVIGASLNFEFNPLHPMPALPTTIYNYAGSAYASQRTAAWGVAFILVVLVLALSLGSRLISARMRKERH